MSRLYFKISAYFFENGRKQKSRVLEPFFTLSFLLGKMRKFALLWPILFASKLGSEHIIFVGNRQKFNEL
jgi:hypothetical protein